MTTTAVANSLPDPRGGEPSAGPPSGGRPRDARIDEAVLRATLALLEEVGYLRLTVAAIAARAGTNKPAIYRRWPTKAHLVHEAVFPMSGRILALPDEGDVRGVVRALVAVGAEFLGRPAARAAVPGLMAEMADGSGLRADVLRHFETATWGWLQQRLDVAIGANEVRRGVRSSTVLELVSGATLVATSLRPGAGLDDTWIDHVVDVILGGIAA